MNNGSNLASTLEVFVCGISDVGLVRQNNEDVWAELPEVRFYILADGMGGHQAGEVASRETTEILCRLLHKYFKGKPKSADEAIEEMKRAICQTNGHIFKLGRSHSELRGMGTTLCLLHIREKEVIYAHVGDSRIYRYRDGHLKLLTKDHSLLSDLVDLGQILDEAPDGFHYKNIITRAIGTEAEVEPSIEKDHWHSRDIYLLCSDGLSDAISTTEMEKILKHSASLSEAAMSLVSLSKVKGGHDNVTILLVQPFNSSPFKESL